jgi:selenocysteine lyase/cysteine desulfurase
VLDRRRFLGRAGLAVGAAALAGGSADEALAEEEAYDPRSWRSVRAQFRLQPGVAHLAGFLLAAHPSPVRRAIERHRRGLDANPAEYLHANQARLEASVRAEAAAYLGVSPAQIALTDSTTMGLGLLYGGFALRPGDEALTTEHDFYATYEALRLTGATVRRVRLYARPARASVDEIVSSLRRAIGPRTRLVAVTWVHSSTGVKLPVREIAQAIGNRAKLAVDGVHGFGVEADGFGALGCDYLASGCHKWLAGPRGTGVLVARRDGWDAVRQTIPTFDGGGGFGAAMTPGGYHSFEHRWALAEAFRFQRRIGKRRVEARIHALAGRLKRGLAGIRGVTLHTPLDARLSAGIVCCEIAGMSPREAVDRLRRESRVIASVTPYTTPYVRFGPGLYTRDEDIGATLEAVRRLTRRR